VNWGLGLHITNRLNGTTQDRIFSRFPIRIGRNSLNDLSLEECSFVSQFHLVIELLEDKLWVRDLGSTNGTLLKGLVRAPTNQSIELASCGFEFTIVSLDFSVFSVPMEQLQASQPSQRRRLGVTSFLDASKVPQVSASSGDVVTETRACYAAYRAAWSELIRSVDSKLTGMPPDVRVSSLERLRQEFEAVAREPDFDVLCKRHGAQSANRLAVSDAPRHPIESVALESIRELALDFCATAGPLESVDSLVRFVDRVQQVLDVFFRAFISLRDGQRQFESNMAVRQHGGTKPSPTEAAQTATDLSQALLDWRQPSSDGIAHVESTLADFMIHQVALIHGVMTGVRTLLVEFSPAQIEQKAQDPRFNPEGLGIGPYRYKSLWKTLERVHADFTGEDKQIFSVLFGRQFASAYETPFSNGINAPRASRDSRVRSTVPPGERGR
jgi:type VI secretion system protein ImpI